MYINAESSVRDLAIDLPGAKQVFEKFGIDYCCGGGKALREACQEPGLTLSAVVRALEDATVAAKEKEEKLDWSSKPLTELISHILAIHHTFDREEIARIELLIPNVVSMHGKTHPELIQIQSVFGSLKQDLLNHMMKEEQVLFPYLVELQASTEGRSPKPFPFFGTVRNPIRVMSMEHDTAGEMLRSIRELSSNFAVPPEACTSYQTLYEALEALERDLHEHIHLENNVLFPRAVEMEGGID
jgi:regulator of cell morphogenesis and NO signaling